MDWHSQLFTWLWPDSPVQDTPSQDYEARIHGLLGLLHTLQPEKQCQTGKAEAWHRNVAHHLRVEGVLGQHWPQSLCQPMIMKGFDYALNLYPEIGLRHANDIDLLVQPGLFSVVCDELAGRMEQRSSPRENRWLQEAPSAATFVFDDISIDVHRVPIMEHQTRLVVKDLFNRATSGNLGNCSVFFPSTQDRLWLWLHNFSKNSQPLALHHLIDLVLIMKSLSLHESELDHWSPLFVQAHALGLALAFRTALSHLEASGLWCDDISECYLAHTPFTFDRWIRQQQNSTWRLPLKACHRILYSAQGSRKQVMLRLLFRVWSDVCGQPTKRL